MKKKNLRRPREIYSNKIRIHMNIRNKEAFKKSCPYISNIYKIYSDEEKKALVQFSYD